MRYGKILYALIEGAQTVTDILRYMGSSYERSYRRAHGRLTGNTWYEENEAYLANKRKEKQKFYSMLRYLSMQGLIKPIRGKGLIRWSITDSGKNRYENLLNRKPPIPEPPVPKKTRGVSLSIVAYDIPEKKKHLRAWLREVLRLLDYTMLQKSVWAGDTPIPEEYILEMKKYGILDKIDIFEVGKKGTLSQRL